MVKKMMSCWRSWWRSLSKNNFLVLKLGVSIFLVGLGFALLYDRSSDIIPASVKPFLENARVSPSPPISFKSGETPDPSQGNGVESKNSSGKCDLFVGDWVPYQAEPPYTNNSCIFIEDHQNCMKNGRPDTGYLHWRWNPLGCELPQLQPERFLDLMRNKRWALIGDSISRNHVQSLLCILSTVENAVQVYHDKGFKSRRWIFPSYNFTISVIWSPFLAKAVIFEDINGVSTSEIELHLDKLDSSWTELLEGFDYMIFSSGKWFTKSAIYYEGDKVLGCHYCPKRNFTELGFNFAFRRVIKNVFNHIIASKHKGTVFYRTLTPDHFENGQWFSGGTCNRTAPSKEGEFELNEIDSYLRHIELAEFEKASTKASENSVNLKLFDMTSLSLLRPDGHPGPYRFFQPYAKRKNPKVINDCLHWCLPGPIDYWSRILIELVVNG